MKLKYSYQTKFSPSLGAIPTVSFWLNVISKDGSLSLLFLFDTGADVTSLPVSAAQKLGINLDKCPKEPMSGYEGTTILVYKSAITINFNKKPVTIPCVFNANEEVPILLGRAGILNKFTIVLDGKKKVATFEEI